MSKGVQRKAAFALGGRVPQQPGSQRMAGFMERDGHQCHQRADEIIGCPCHKHLLKNNIFYYNTIFCRLSNPCCIRLEKDDGNFEKGLHFARVSGKIVKLII